MCTSFTVNRSRTIVGWNLDLLDMECRVRPEPEGVFIEINDSEQGWMPLFGANARGDFVGMPTCWPFDSRSNPDPDKEQVNVINLDMDLLLQKKTLSELRTIAEEGRVCSVPGVTFMASLCDAQGNVLHIIPGQGSMYREKPDHALLTNFSPFKQDREPHPWMGWDRYLKAEEMLDKPLPDFGVNDAFAVLKAVAQEVCPTVVSMVFDVQERTVYWCENRAFEQIRTKKLTRKI